MSQPEEIDQFDHREGESEMNRCLRRAALWVAPRKHQRARRLWRRELLRVKGWRRAMALDFGLWSLNFVRLPTMSSPWARSPITKNQAQSTAARFALTRETLRYSSSFPVSPAPLPSAQSATADSTRGASPRRG